MPKLKRGPRRTPPPVRIVIKEVPLVVKPPEKPKAVPVPVAVAAAAANTAPEPPHYY